MDHGYKKEDQALIYIDVLTEGDTIKILYSDEGAPLSEEDQEKLFDPFYTSSRNPKHSGLGLNLVYNIITNVFNGKIQVKSQEGRGVSYEMLLRTNFKFDLEN